VLLRYRNLIAISGLLGLLSFGAFSLSEANLYVANGAFAARATKSSQVPGAAQIGLTLGIVDIAQSTMFYAELARSNSVLIPVAEKTYTVKTEKGTRSGPLAMFKDVKASTPLAAATMVAKTLPDEIAVLTSGRSGVVTLLVSDKDPQIAAQITMNILRELDSYSTTSRKEQAVAERKFVEQLLSESRGKLSDAEERLARFRQQNREFETAPQLKIEDDQLTRDVDLAQQDYASLAASYQQARIEEVRDLSAIRIVEYPDVPVVPQRKEAARKTLIGLVTGLFVGIVIAFLRERAEEKRRLKDGSFVAFSEVRREASADPLHILAPLTRSSAES
jgi:uncharacterized protein involved in exopolysaccharide biosynthesis